MATTQQTTSSASLYVGDLAEDVLEADLFEVFSPIGTLASIRLIRDSASYRSLCYAYVNYEDVQSAERALDILNHTPIKSKPCRVMWKNADISLRKSGIGNLYVKNLSSSVDNKALNEAFSIYGNILSCKVMAKNTGESAGFGFVQFDSEEAANKAIAGLHDTDVAGRQIFVSHFKCRKDREAELATTREPLVEATPVFTNLYIKDFPVEWSEDILRTIFDEVIGANVTSLAIKVDTKLNRPFGFVNLESADSATDAVDILHGRMSTATGLLSREESEKIIAEQTEILKKEAMEAAAAAGGEYKERVLVIPGRLYVARAQNKKEREAILREQFEERGVARQAAANSLTQHFYNGSNLFIKFLATTVDDEQLKSIFGKFGNIISARVNRDKENNSPKGFGFLAFDNNQSALAAVSALHNSYIEGITAEGKQLHVSIAERRVTGQHKDAAVENSINNAKALSGSSRTRKTALTTTITNNINGKKTLPGSKLTSVNGTTRKTETLFEKLSKIDNIDEQRRSIGEYLYMAIAKIEPQHAPKLTGMMLEMPLNVLCALVENPEPLRAKIDEAMDVLRAHNAM